MARLLLKDLMPGTLYKLQLRSKDQDSFSEWGRLYDLATSTDVIPPDVPSWAPSDEWIVSGDAFVATWQELNFTLDQNKDFSHYEIKLSDGVSNYTVRTTNTSYTLTFEQNRYFFDTPEATVTAQVRSVDLVGNTSAYNDLKSATNPAPAAPASIGVTALYDSVKIEWEPVADTDLIGYKLQVSTTSSSTGFTDVYNGPDVGYIHNTTAFLTDHWYRVYAVDKFASLSSATTSGAIKPKSALTVDITPPAAPTGLGVGTSFDVGTQQSIVDLSWVASVSTDVSRYEIRYSTDESTWEYLTVGNDVTIAFIETIPDTDYFFAIRAVDISGNASAFTNFTPYPSTTAEDTNPPSQPAAPTASVGTQKLQVVIDGLKQAGGAMEADVDYYEVFASTSSGFTTYDSTTMLGTVQKGPAIIETFQIPAQGASGTTETWYVKVRAVDRSGNVSAASNQATAAVGLILTANIGDAQITNAKITSIVASKITTGTISANTITLGATGNLIVDSTGVIKTNNWIPNSTGYRLTATTFELNQGTIYAGGLKIRDGRNIMASTYESFESTSAYSFGKLGGSLNNGAQQTPTIVTTGNKFGYQHLRNQWTTTTTNQNRLYLAPTTTTYNITVEAGLQYILSAYVWNTGAVNTNVILGIDWATAADAFISSVQPASQTINAATLVGSAVRMSGTATAPANAAKAVVYVQSTTLTNGAGFDIDGIQVETVEGGITTPSDWKSSGATTIDGGLIRTDELRSRDNLTINGITLPYWAITKSGSALFSDLIVRGNAVVGGALAEDIDGTVTGAGSSLRSYNYVAGNSGWAIYSNGMAEFRSVAVGSFNGSALAPGTVSAETFVASSVLSNEIIVTGSIRTKGAMGEDISLDDAGFHVLGAFQVSITNKALSGNVATLTTFSDHGFSVGNKLVVSGVNTSGESFNGTWTVKATPSSNTFTYDCVGADVSSTASIGGIAQSLSTTLEQPTLIDFPTDGLNPNIISGVLTGQTVIAKENLLISNNASVEPSAEFTISNGIENPKIAATVAENLPFTTTADFLAYTDARGLRIEVPLASGQDGVDVYTIGASAFEDSTTYEFTIAIQKYNGTTKSISEVKAPAIIFTEVMGSNATGYGWFRGAELRNFVLCNGYWWSIIKRSYSSTSSGTSTAKEKLSLLRVDPSGWSTTEYPILEATTGYYADWCIGLDYTTANTLVLGLSSTVTAAADKNFVSGVIGITRVTTEDMATHTITLSSGAPSMSGGFVVKSALITLNNVGMAGTQGSFSSIHRGAFDYGANKVIIKDNGAQNPVQADGKYFKVYNTSGTRETALEWETNTGTSSFGFYWDTTDSKFAEMKWNIVSGEEVQAKVSKYAGGTGLWTDTSAAKTFWVGYSWYDSVATTQETQIGTSKSISLPKRRDISVTIPEIPYKGTTDYPDRARIWVVQNTTSPAVTSSTWKKRGEIYYPATSMVVPLTPSAPADTPQASNQFGASAVAGKIISASVDLVSAPNIRLSGDGTWRLGPYSFGNTKTEGPSIGRLYTALGSHTTSLANATITVVGSGWVGSEAIGTGAGAMFSAYSAGSWTVAYPGIYSINASCSFASNATGRRIVMIFVNGTQVRRTDVGAGGLTSVPISHMISLVATDVITIRVYQNSGGALALDGGSVDHVFQMMRVG